MNSSDVISQRLQNQKLSTPEFRQPVDVVRWFGAVQAQDFKAAKWALGLRMRRATNASIEATFNEGRILRTHLMRPTWHFVAPDDIRWLLQLTAPRVNLKCGPNYRKYELDATIFKRANRILTNALKGGKHLTRAALKTRLNRAGLEADDAIRLAHIFLRAELDGVVCSGPLIGKQFTYALLEERVPATKPLTRERGPRETDATVFHESWTGNVAGFCLVVRTDDGRRQTRHRPRSQRDQRSVARGKVLLERANSAHARDAAFGSSAACF